MCVCVLSQEHVGSQFDPNSPDFTLDSVVSLRLDTHAEFIAELSVNATKELAIENNIKVRVRCMHACMYLRTYALAWLHSQRAARIRDVYCAASMCALLCCVAYRLLSQPGVASPWTWSSTSRRTSYAALRRYVRTTADTDPHPQTRGTSGSLCMLLRLICVWNVCVCVQVFAALEENSVTLSTMKASKYFIVFEKEISYWEKTLSHISETVEIILQVRTIAHVHNAACRQGMTHG